MHHDRVHLAYQLYQAFPASPGFSKIVYVVKKAERRQPGNEAGIAACHLSSYHGHCSEVSEVPDYLVKHLEAVECSSKAT